MPKLSRISVTTLFLMLFALKANAQEKFTDNLKLMVNYQYGFVLPEYSFIAQATNEYVQSLDIAIMKERYGRDFYEQKFKYPENGVALFYTTLGNKEVFGNAIALNYFFRLNIVDRERFRFFNRMGIGLGYLTKTFNAGNNHMNVAIGSRINIHYNLRFGASYRIGEKLEANAGISFDHFSNGNTSEPNIGLNNVTFYGGMSYLLGKRIERIKQEIPEHKRKFNWEVFMGFGGKHTRAFSSRYYFTTSAALETHYELARGFHLGAGIDFFYDTSIKSQLEKLEEPYKGHYSFQSGIHFSQTIAYRKFRFTLQEGFYIGLIERINRKPMYNRGILKYYIKDNWSLRITMKSHLHILDYPEIGVGYKFK